MITLNWYVAYTKTRCEQKVANLLSRKHIRTYCPLHRVQNYWSDWKRMVLEPLFPSYVFVHIPESEQNSVFQTSGVLSLVHWLDKPAVIPDDEIVMIMQFLKEHENVNMQKKVPENDSQVLPEPYFNNPHAVQSINNAIQISLTTMGFILYSPYKPETIIMPDIENGSVAF